MPMYRLLIVDDEHYIVESLYELFSEQEYPEFEVLTAYYGDEALDLLQSQKVDIVLLDINMPGLSGIQVAEQIVKNWPTCKIIFLTGYASFDYIYQIEKMKNTSYLLKTEDNDTIVRGVVNAVYEIEEERAVQLLTDQTKQNQCYLRYLLHREILAGFLHGKQLYELRSKIRSNSESFIFDVNTPVHLLYLKLKWMPNSPWDGDFSNQAVQLSLCLSQYLNEKYQISLTAVDQTTIIVFLQPVTSEPLMIPHSIYMKECLNDWISSQSQDSPYQLFLLILQQAIPWNNIGKTFDLLQNYYNRTLLPDIPQYGRIAFIDEETLILQKKRDDSSNPAIPSDLVQEIAIHLVSGNAGKINHCLDQLFDYLTAIQSMHNLNGIRLYHAVSNIFIEYLVQRRLEEKAALKTGLYKLYNLNQFDNWHELISYYRELTDIVLEITERKEFNIKMENLEQIKRYIQNNLSRNLTLNEIANSINYNSSYISRYFKQMTGQSISQYMMQCRMDFAKKYLISSDESIQGIAEKLGFESSQYFSIVFKKYTGLSPREYRVQAASGMREDG